MTKQKVKVLFTDFWHPQTEEEIRKNRLFILLAKHFDLEFSDDPDFVIYSCLGDTFLQYDCIRIYYGGENLRPNFDECDYAFCYDYPDDDRGYRLPLYRLYREFDLLQQKRKNSDIDEIIRQKQRFCGFVYSNTRGKDRVKFFKQLNKYKKVDSGGKILNNMGHRIPNTCEFYKTCKFVVAFESGLYPGYTTEKILQVLLVGAVPIYWGNPRVKEDINPEVFIDCSEFRNFKQVIEKVKEVDNDDELYRKYLSAPYFPHDSENETVREENIFAKFEQIFNEKKHRRPLGIDTRPKPGILSRIKSRLLPK